MKRSAAHRSVASDHADRPRPVSGSADRQGNMHYRRVDPLSTPTISLLRRPACGHVACSGRAFGSVGLPARYPCRDTSLPVCTMRMAG